MEDPTNNPQPRNPQASLLGLPRELRDLIIHPIIIKPTNTITMLPNFSCHANEISASQPPICNASQQLRAEMLPTFYSSNTFTAQLDNEFDLECAKSWLRAIGDANIAHLRKVCLCGWTQVPMEGGGILRRFVQVGLDLKGGGLEVETRDPDLPTAFRIPKVDSTKVDKGVEELKGAFGRMFEARGGRSFDVGSLAGLMDGFSALCTGY